MMLSSAPIIDTSFFLTGDLLIPQQLTDQIGLQPTECGVKGEMLPGRLVPSPKNYWVVTVQDQRHYDIDESITEVLNIIWPYREKFIECMNKFSLKATMCVYVKIYEDRPIYQLTPQTLKRLTYLNIHFIMDDILDYRE